LLLLAVTPFLFCALYYQLITLRFITMAIPFALVGISALFADLGRDSLLRRVSVLGAFFLIVCESTAALPAQFASGARGDIQDSVQYLDANYVNGDAIVFNATYMQVPFDYHFRRHRIEMNKLGFPESIYSWWQRSAFKGWGGPVITHQDLSDFLEKTKENRRIWLIVNDENVFYDEFELLRKSFGQSRRLQARKVFKSVTIYLYTSLD
jgi:hypothetical protein